MAVPKKSPTAAATPTLTIRLEDRIRNRAYELYEARGNHDGHEVEDWLEAEAEIRGNRAARGVAA
ncbi:MAG: DUF2934 domain-containing protein [Terriglobales bacterium]